MWHIERGAYGGCLLQGEACTGLRRKEFDFCSSGISSISTKRCRRRNILTTTLLTKTRDFCVAERERKKGRVGEREEKQENEEQEEEERGRRRKETKVGRGSKCREAGVSSCLVCVCDVSSVAQVSFLLLLLFLFFSEAPPRETLQKYGALHRHRVSQFSSSSLSSSSSSLSSAPSLQIDTRMYGFCTTCISYFAGRHTYIYWHTYID